MSTRVLVLTSSTGSGHDMRAKAFAAWAGEIYGEKVQVRIDQVIENGSLLGRFGVWVYNTIQRHAPFLHIIYFFIVELFVFTHGKSVSFGGRYYRRLLRSWRPDVILSVHDSTNRGYFEDAKRLLGEKVRCVTYCGEFTGGYGYSRNWICPAADLLIARTRAARDYVVGLGFPEDRTAVFHKFLPPESFHNAIPPTERMAQLTQLGLHPDRFTVFLSTGGYGANHHAHFLKAMLPMAADVQAIVICGRNQSVFRQLARWKDQHPQLGLFLEGYSDRVADFMQLSDAIVTRGGANTTMEALHFECPMLYNALGGLMPQEHCTVRYFLQNGAAVLIRSPRQLDKVLHSWKDRGAAYRSIRQRLRELNHEEDPRDLIRLIVGQSGD